MKQIEEVIKLLANEREWLTRQLEIYRIAVDWLTRNEEKLHSALCCGDLVSLSVLGSITMLKAANHVSALRLTTLWPGKWPRVAYDGTITYLRREDNMEMHISTEDAGAHCKWEEQEVEVPATKKVQKVLVCNENQAV